MSRFLTSLALLVALPSLAAIPDGYYSSIDGLTGDAICAALHSKIAPHTSLGYDNLYVMYQTSDLTAQGYIWDMYSTCDFANPGDKCGTYKKVCDCFNREHSVPASWFGDAKGSPMYCDPFHVVPTDGYVNNQRSNYPLGECSGGTRLSNQSLCKLGSSSFPGYTGIGKVFEVDDQYKGDFARAYFYMVTCYRDKNFTQSGGGSTMFTWSNGKAGFTPYTVALMLKWHRQDPVSDKEIRRNEAIYARQGNRNPFIDYPCLAEYIWGQYKTESLILATLMASSDDNYESSDRTGCNCTTDLPTLLTPKNGATLHVGSASVGESVYQDLYLSAVNLTQPLSLEVSGTNAAFFSLHTSSIPAASANVGATLRITYTPTATGNHTATLTISSPELSAQRTVTLTADSKAELVTPATGTDYVFVAEGINDVVTQVVHVKATNLTSDLYIGIAKTGQGTFSVAPASLTAAQANAGADLTVTYAPSALGVVESNLIVNSLGKEFTQPTIRLSGSCVFELLPVTGISSSSATLNWVDAGVNEYMVDVFFVNQIDIPEVVVFDDVAGADATKVMYFDNKDDGYIRLGSGSKGGSISYSDVDLSRGGQITITAKAYNSKDNPSMKVTVNGSSSSFPLSTSDEDYTIDVEPGAPDHSSIKIESTSGNQRFYVKRVRVTTGGTKEERVHLSGYPRTETYLFHTLNGLLPDTEYSYSVTPSGETESDIFTFITDPDDTGLSDVYMRDGNRKFVNAAGHLLLRHGEHLYSATGIMLQ
ncbi:MAG: endonuclease [Paludibacteraceae bacterium]|nr:endonuclease [Paludibacteraceae bacterium]